MDKLAMPADMPRGLGNCGVVAVALLAGVSHEEAWTVTGRVLRDIYGARFMRRWRGATNHLARVEALNRLGFEVLCVPVRRMQLATLVNSGKLRPGVSYMVRTAGHAQVVRDDLVYDQQSPGVPVSEFWGRRKYVTHVHYAERREAETLAA